jgi:hypothetical protein
MKFIVRLYLSTDEFVVNLVVIRVILIEMTIARRNAIDTDRVTIDSNER